MKCLNDLNPQVEVVDVGGILAEMRMIKDKYELDYIRKAGKIRFTAMDKTLSIIKGGLSETEIVGEVYKILYKLDSEEPHIYVNVGPNPRVHAEPFRDIRVKKEYSLQLLLEPTIIDIMSI